LGKLLFKKKTEKPLALIASSMVANVSGLVEIAEHKLSQDRNPQDQMVLDLESLEID